MTISLLSAIKSAYAVIKKDAIVTTPLLASALLINTAFTHFNIVEMLKSPSDKLLILLTSASFCKLVFYVLFVHFLYQLDTQGAISIPSAIGRSMAHLPKLLFRLIMLMLPLVAIIFGLEYLSKFIKDLQMVGTLILIPALGLWLITLVASIVTVQFSPIFILENPKASLKNHAAHLIRILRYFPKRIFYLECFNIYIQILTAFLSITFNDIPLLGPSLFRGGIQAALDIIMLSTGYFYYKQLKSHLPPGEIASVVV